MCTRFILWDRYNYIMKVFSNSQKESNGFTVERDKRYKLHLWAALSKVSVVSLCPHNRIFSAGAVRCFGDNDWLCSEVCHFQEVLALNTARASTTKDGCRRGQPRCAMPAEWRGSFVSNFAPLHCGKQKEGKCSLPPPLLILFYLVTSPLSYLPVYLQRGCPSR